MRRWARWLLGGACVGSLPPAHGLTLDCAQSRAAEHVLTLPAELNLVPPTQGAAFLVIDERGVDVVIERIDDAGTHIAYDLPPADWSSTVVALRPAPERLRVTSLVPTRTGARLQLTMLCADAGLPAVHVEILRALDAATRAVASAGDARLTAAARQQARDRAVALLGGVALAAARVPELTWVRAQALHTQGYLHNQSARSADSASAYAAATRAWRAAGDEHRALWAALRQAQQWSRRGEHARALRALERIASAEAAQSDAKLRGVATNDRCLILGHDGRLDDASTCYARALTIYQQAGERGEYTLTLANAADVSLERGALTKARTDASRALDQARALGLARPHTLAALVLGKAERLLGNLSAATTLFLEAESAAQQLGDRNLRANARRQLGSTMALRGDWSRAEFYGRLAYDGHTSGEYWPDAALALLGVAQAQFQRGDERGAAASADQVLELIERHELASSRAPALLLRAELCAAHAALDCAQSTLSELEREPATREYALEIRVQSLRADVHALRGEPHVARRTLTHALTQTRRAGDWFGEIRVRERLAELQLAQDDASGALVEFETALARREQLARNQLMPPRPGAYTRDERAALAGHLSALRQTQGVTREAVLARLAVLERMRTTLGDRNTHDTTANATAETTQVLENLSAAVRAHWDLDTPIADDAPSVQELITRLESLRGPAATVRVASGTTDMLLRADTDTADTLVLFAGAGKVWRWWLHDGIVDEQIGADSMTLGNHAATLVRLARDPASGVDAIQAAARELRADLALSEATWDDDTVLTIMADRVLADLPWHLVFGDARGSPVIATTLALDAMGGDALCCAGAALYAFADPTVALEAGTTPRAPTARTLVRLPGSRAEARAAARIWGATNSTVRLGGEATRAQALAALAHPNAVVHFATHGLIDAAAPQLSGLLVVDGAQLGLLAWSDILAQRAQARLVVLGACETGASGTANGHGSPSLAQAFLYAGTREVVAPLWPISDAASVHFMTAFYRELAAGVAPAAALRAAQHTMRQDTRYAHPYYWAGFVSVTRGMLAR